MQKDTRTATRAQIDQARELIQSLKYDVEWYDDFSKLTRGQMARLIDRLKLELEAQQ